MINDEQAESLAASDFPNISIGELYNERYKILAILGKGGMGIAYKAFDTKLEKLVALKVLLPHRLLNAKGAGRFEREAKTASRLSHPRIAKVYDFAVLAGEQPYLVMEYLDGKTLAQLIEAEGQLPLEETLEIFIQICDALAYAHSNDILHRDIKPSNIMVNRNVNPLNAKLLDFGIAKPLGAKNSTYQTVTEKAEGETSAMCAFCLNFTGCKFLKLYAVDVKRSFETAKPLFDRAISIQKKVDDPYSLQLANLLTMQGIACLNRDLINEARPRFERVLKILHSAPPGSEEANSKTTTLVSLADIYSRTKQFDRIPALCSELLSSYDKCSIEEKKKCAEGLRRIADTLRMNGHRTKDPVGSYQLAERAYQTFILLFPHLPDRKAETLATVYESLGSAYFREARRGNADRFSLAKRWYKQAIRFREEMLEPDVASIARIQLKLGNVLSAEGLLDEARSVNDRGLSLYEKSKGKNSIEYAEALLYAGELDCRQSQLVKAEEKFVRALHICKQVGKTDTNVAAALNADLGYCRSDRGLYAEALPPLQIARRLYLSRSGSECPNLVQLNKYLTEIYKHLQQEKSGRGTERLQPHG